MEPDRTLNAIAIRMPLVGVFFVLVLSSKVAFAFSFGVADLFNVYSMGNIMSSDSAYGGITGATGDITLDNFSIGLRAAAASDLSLFVGGNVNYSGGSIFNGGIEVGGSVNVSNAFLDGSISGGGTVVVTESTIRGIHADGNVGMSNLSVLGSVDSGGDITGSEGTVTGSVNAEGTATIAGSMSVGGGINASTPFVPDSHIDHGAIRDALTAASSDFKGRSATATFTTGADTIIFEGVAGENIFDLSVSDLRSPFGTIEFVGPSDALFILNISGADAGIVDKGFSLLNGVAAGGILYNLFEATTLDLADIGLPGTVLAPFATTTFNDAVIDGDLYVGDLRGSYGQINFLANEPSAVPEPSTGLLFVSGLIGFMLARKIKARHFS